MQSPKRRALSELTDAKEQRIQAGIAADPNNPEWTAEDFARARPASEVLPPPLYAALIRPRGRPKSAAPKEAVKLRIDPKTLAAFRATGPGWQTRMNAILKAAAKSLEGSDKKTLRAKATKSATRTTAQKRLRSKAG